MCWTTVCIWSELLYLKHAVWFFLNTGPSAGLRAFCAEVQLMKWTFMLKWTPSWNNWSPPSGTFNTSAHKSNDQRIFDLWKVGIHGFAAYSWFLDFSQIHCGYDTMKVITDKNILCTGQYKKLPPIAQETRLKTAAAQTESWPPCH